MSDTRYELGGIDLSYCQFDWPIYRGTRPRVTVIRQPVERFEEFAGLPYITSLHISHSYGDGVNPPAAPLDNQNVRLIEVRKVSDLACDLYLSDVRHDLAKRVCPRDFMLRWKDGYLNGTFVTGVLAALNDISGDLPELQKSFAPDVFERVLDATVTLPDDVLTSGMILPDALDKLFEKMGIHMVVGPDGLVRFVSRRDVGPNVLPPQAAYLWMLGGSPSWLNTQRKLRGLPKKIRCHYRERHALKVRNVVTSNTSTSARKSNELHIELEQVYLSGGKYLTLRELLLAHHFAADAISNEQIAEKIMSANFEGTAIERLNAQAKDADTEAVIKALKSSWNRLLRVKFIDDLGRSGGWQEFIFGSWITTTDKDGNNVYTGAVGGASVRGIYTEIYAAAIAKYTEDQQTLEGAIVARTHREVKDGGDSLPSMPVTVAWDGPAGEAEGVLRITQTTPADENEVWPGALTPDDDLVIGLSSGGVHVDDQGVAWPTDFDLRWPSKENVKFNPDLEIWVHMVAIRRLPNTFEKWTTVEVEGFPDGDVEVMDLEVGEELYAIRQLVDATHPEGAESGEVTYGGAGLGVLLNRDQVVADAKRRIARVKEDLMRNLEGQATSLGVVLAGEVLPNGAISEIVVEVDGVSVQSTMFVGNLADNEARERLAQQRESRRVITHGGRHAA